MPRYVVANNYIQARHRKLASMILAKFALGEGQRLRVLQIDPRILMNRGAHHGIHYLDRLNDLSAILTLYLKDQGADTAFVIVHSMRSKGVQEWGHGY